MKALPRGLTMHAILLLLSLLPGALPPTLHKCVGADGVASYQNLPCPDGQRTAWARRPDPAADQARPAPVAAPSPSPPRRQAVAARPPAVRSQADPARSRCADARRAADLTRDRLWNRLSFRQRSDLDAKVALACARR